MILLDTYDGKYTELLKRINIIFLSGYILLGEGGAVVTNKLQIKKIMESIRDWSEIIYCPPGKDNTCKKRYDWQLGGLPPGMIINIYILT